MGSQRRSAEENQEQMWRGNLLLHRHLKGSDKPIRDNQAWDWLKGRRVGKLSETGTHLVGEDSCDHRGLPLLCTSAALASHLQRHNPVIPWAGLAQHPGCCPWQQLTKDTWSRKKVPFCPCLPPVSLWHPTLHPLCIKNTNFPIHLLSVEAKYVFSRFLKTCLVSISSLVF